MIWKQLLLWWIHPSLPDHVSPLLLPGEALVIFFAVGRGVGERVEGGGPRLVLCQSFKAQGDTLNNGAPVPTVGAHTAHACTLLPAYSKVCFSMGPKTLSNKMFSDCVWAACYYLQPQHSLLCY